MMGHSGHDEGAALIGRSDTFMEEPDPQRSPPSPARSRREHRHDDYRHKRAIQGFLLLAIVAVVLWNVFGSDGSVIRPSPLRSAIGPAHQARLSQAADTVAHRVSPTLPITSTETAPGTGPELKPQRPATSRLSSLGTVRSVKARHPQSLVGIVRNSSWQQQSYWPASLTWKTELRALKPESDGKTCTLIQDPKNDPSRPMNAAALENVHSIRLPNRPFYFATPDYKCPTIEMVDAGTCIGLSHNSKFGCLPSFLIIGTMKGGTAELQGWLSNHPNLHRWGGDSKNGAGEAHFFDNLKSREEMQDRWVKDYLLGGFRMSELTELEEEYTFEKTPKYLSSDQLSVELLHEFLPSAKLIAILRKPSSRAYSHFQHKCRQERIFRVSPQSSSRAAGVVLTSGSASSAHKILRSYEYARDLDIAEVELMPYPCSPEDFDRLMRTNSTSGRQNEQIMDQDLADGGILDRGKYAVHLEKYLKHFRKEQLLLLLTEELFAGTIDMMNRIQGFLGLPFFDYEPHAVVNERGFTVFEGMSSKANAIAYQPMLPSTKRLLEAYFRPHNKALASMVEPARMARYWYDPALDDPLELEISEIVQGDDD